MTGVQTCTVDAEDDGVRLDRWFKRHFPAIPHGRLEKLLRTGQVRVDGKRAESSSRVAAGQSIRVPPLGEAPRIRPPRNEQCLRRLDYLIRQRSKRLFCIKIPM